MPTAATAIAASSLRTLRHTPRRKSTCGDEGTCSTSLSVGAGLGSAAAVAAALKGGSATLARGRDRFRWRLHHVAGARGIAAAGAAEVVSPATGSAAIAPQGRHFREKGSRHAAALQLLGEQLERARTGGAPVDPVFNLPKKIGEVVSRRPPVDTEVLGAHVPPHGAPPGMPDEAGFTRDFLYGADGRPAPGTPVVPCHGWDAADETTKRDLIEKSLAELRRAGYVVLERLLQADKIRAAGDEFAEYRTSRPKGVTFSRMRAQRDMTIPPFSGIWTEDWLIRHPLVLALLARHLRNSTDTRNDKAAEMEFAHWVARGASLDDFYHGAKSAGYPMLDLLVVVDTPAGAPAQTRHRDTILPGPCASLGVHIPLTPLQLDPLNGPIGFTPASHTLLGADAVNRDVVGAAPLGSVILYDSFTEHHGLENASDAPRAALFAWYRVPGVYSGHTDENFGLEGLELTMKFRRHLQERLERVVAEERAITHPGQTLAGQSSCGLFEAGPAAALAEWGEERVCFRCNCTTGEGFHDRGWWFCRRCLDASRRAGAISPEPHPGNIAPPLPDPGRFPEERLLGFESQGMNIRPSRGRHKLTLLRERGLFLPQDPPARWLDGISTEPQPEGWKNALRKATGEIPRMDGF